MALSRRFGNIKPVGVDSTEEDTEDDEELRFKLFGRKDRFKYSDPSKISFDSCCRDIADSSENEDDTLLEDMAPDWMEEFRCILRSCKTPEETPRGKPPMFDKVFGEMNHAPLDTLRASVERYNHLSEDREAQVVPKCPLLMDHIANSNDRGNDFCTRSDPSCKFRQKNPCFEDTSTKSITCIKDNFEGNGDISNPVLDDKEKNIQEALAVGNDKDQLDPVTIRKKENSMPDKSNVAKEKNVTVVSQNVFYKEIESHESQGAKANSETTLAQKCAVEDNNLEKKLEVENKFYDKLAKVSQRYIPNVFGKPSDTVKKSEKNKHLELNTNEKKIILKTESDENKVKNKTKEANDNKHKISSKKPVDEKKALDNSNRGEHKENVRKEIKSLKSSSEYKSEVVKKADELRAKSHSQKVTTKSTKPEDQAKNSSDSEKKVNIDSAKDSTKDISTVEKDAMTKLEMSTKVIPAAVCKDKVSSTQHTVDKKKVSAVKSSVVETKAKAYSALPPYESEDFKKTKTYNITPASSFPLDELLPAPKKRTHDEIDSKNSSTGQRKRHASNQPAKQTADVLKNPVQIQSNSKVQAQMTSEYHQNVFYGTVYEASDVTNPWHSETPYGQCQDYTEATGYESENCRISHFVNRNLAGIMSAIQSGNPEVISTIQEALYREIGLNLQALAAKAKPQTDIARIEEQTDTRPIGFYKERSVAEDRFSFPGAAGDNRPVETCSEAKQNEELFHLFVQQCKELVQTEEDKAKLMSLVKLLKNESGNSLTSTGFTPPDRVDKRYGTETNADSNSVDSEQGSPDNKTSVLNNCLFEGRTMLKGGVKPRHIPKTTTYKAGKGRPTDPRPPKDEQTSEAVYIKLPPFVWEMWEERKIKKVIALGENPVQSYSQKSKSSTNNSYNPHKVLQSTTSTKTDKSRVDPGSNKMAECKKASKADSSEKKYNSQQSRNSFDKIQKSKRELESKSSNRPVTQEKTHEPAGVKKEDALSQSEKLESSSSSKLTEMKKEQSSKIKEDACDSKSTSSSTKISTGNANKKQASLDEKIAGCNFDKFSSKNWAPVSTFSFSSNEKSCKIPVMISTKHIKDKGVDSEQRLKYSSKTSLIKIVPVDNKVFAGQSKETKQKGHYNPSGTNTNVIGMEHDSDADIEETPRNNSKILKTSTVTSSTQEHRNTGKENKKYYGDDSVRVEIRDRKTSVERQDRVKPTNIEDKVRDRSASADKDFRSKPSTIETKKKLDKSEKERKMQYDLNKRDGVKSVSAKEKKERTSVDKEVIERMKYVERTEKDGKSLEKVEHRKKEDVMARSNYSSRGYRIRQFSMSSVDSSTSSVAAERDPSTRPPSSSLSRNRHQSSMATNCRDRRESSKDSRERSKDSREIAKGSRERFYDSRERSKRGRERSYDSRERSYDSRERSYDSRERSKDSREREKPSKESKERKRHHTTLELHNNESKKRRCETAQEEKRRYSHGDTRKHSQSTGTSRLKESQNSEYYGKVTYMCDKDYRLPDFEAKGTVSYRSQNFRKEVLDKGRREYKPKINIKHVDLGHAQYSSSKKSTHMYLEESGHKKSKIQDYHLPSEQSRNVIFREADPTSHSTDAEIPKAYVENDDSAKDKRMKITARPKKDLKSFEKDRQFLEGFKRRLSGDKVQPEQNIASIDKCAKTMTAAELAQERKDRLFLENCKKGILERAEKAKVGKAKSVSGVGAGGAKTAKAGTCERGILSYKDMLDLANLEDV